ncbi:patatin-like phospholipase family protein [Pseudomonas sp. C27(2019)]|uniref:patatin-like phospholipase family protein n=1 Tax=Pseudomonas sp. C27(2019) TaxID=2604941 RepID=UPI001243C1B1|nr:patatin-like phospholipase family protein [Pseudomonas sp. C27(2019)]QEY59219.1 patatin-like phospholipase family protein [Pseudomonas sp. C27(2019)]
MVKKSINLALQGGGSHGAFTWGVLDYLMEDGRVSVEGISGTSAGAMNAAVLAQGYMEGGADGARESLETFWRHVSHMGRFSPIKRSPLSILTGRWDLDDSPAYVMLDLFSRVASPYDTNPLNINPLRELVESTIDFEKVRACSVLKLFVAATNVHTGKIKVFEREELTADMVLASACLPSYFQAVEIDGVPYWDGGYVGNPPMYPLFHTTQSKDILIVQINPIERNETPKTAQEIQNRVNEISFNSSLLRELRGIDFVTRQLRENKLDRSRYSEILVHRIEATEQINPLSASSKVNSEWKFLTHLRDIGRESARAFLDEHYDSLGKESTLDLRREFS